MGFIAVALLSPIALTRGGATLLPEAEQGHESGLFAVVTMTDGTIQTVKVEGVGCTVSMCSRTRIEVKNERNSLERVWLDSISVIRETSGSSALFLMKDGTQRRLSLLTGFRVLYLGSGPGLPAKLDLGKVRSLQFNSTTPPIERGR
jgi:hypothetical protein